MGDITLLKVANILSESVVDGLGIRTVVFFQGCPRHCYGCHNEALIPFEGGTEYSATELADIILRYLTPIHRGVTFTGGDPLSQPDGLMDLIYLLRKEKPDLNIWVYTGFTYEEVADMPLVNSFDVLVDGPFIMSQRNLDLPFRGSNNQRLIDIPQTIAKKEVVELDL